MASDPVLSRQEMITLCNQMADDCSCEQCQKFLPIAQALQEDWQTAALLKDRTRAAIRDRRQAGESITDLATDYGVPEAFVEALCAWQLGADAALVPRLRELAERWRNKAEEFEMPYSSALEDCADELADVLAARVREGAKETTHD